MSAETVSKSEIVFNALEIKKAATILRSLNNPIRKKIIDHLLIKDGSTVTEILVSLREEQTIISQHLAILRRSRIVTFLKKGKYVYYFLDTKRIIEVQNIIEKLLKEDNVVKLA